MRGSHQLSVPIRTRPTRKPADPLARERLREAQAAETQALSAVCIAEAKVESAIVKRDKAYATADSWVADANAVLDTARSELASVSGVDRAALLLGISKTELRRSVASASDLDGAV
jgi:hypothetical protein